jgi:hypothetical protein
MDTASPRDVTRLLQTWGRREKAAVFEHIPLAHGELCGRLSLGCHCSGPTLPTAAVTRTP